MVEYVTNLEIFLCSCTTFQPSSILVTQKSLMVSQMLGIA